MKKLIIFFSFFAAAFCFSQNLEKMAKDIKDEATELYRSEMASWYGTDVYREKNPKMENIGGYFSYIDNGVPKNIFFSKSKKVIATISFPTN